MTLEKLLKPLVPVLASLSLLMGCEVTRYERVDKEELATIISVKPSIHGNQVELYCPHGKLTLYTFNNKPRFVPGGVIPLKVNELKEVRYEKERKVSETWINAEHDHYHGVINGKVWRTR